MATVTQTLSSSKKDNYNEADLPEFEPMHWSVPLPPLLKSSSLLTVLVLQVSG